MCGRVHKPTVARENGYKSVASPNIDISGSRVLEGEPRTSKLFSSETDGVKESLRCDLSCMACRFAVSSVLGLPRPRFLVVGLPWAGTIVKSASTCSASLSGACWRGAALLLLLLLLLLLEVGSGDCWRRLLSVLDSRP